MKAKDARIEIQRILGFTGDDLDGDFGVLTKAAFAELGILGPNAEWPVPARVWAGEPPETREIIEGTEGWNFKVFVDGEDLVVENVRATCFGGADDPQDSGETASGVSTKNNPGLKACS